MSVSATVELNSASGADNNKNWISNAMEKKPLSHDGSGWEYGVLMPEV